MTIKIAEGLEFLFRFFLLQSTILFFSWLATSKLKSWCLFFRCHMFAGVISLLPNRVLIHGLIPEQIIVAWNRWPSEERVIFFGNCFFQKVWFNYLFKYNLEGDYLFPGCPLIFFLFQPFKVRNYFKKKTPCPSCNFNGRPFTILSSIRCILSRLRNILSRLCYTDHQVLSLLQTVQGGILVYQIE